MKNHPKPWTCPLSKMIAFSDQFEMVSIVEAFRKARIRATPFLHSFLAVIFFEKVPAFV